MKKVILLINLICFSLISQASPLLLSVKNTPVGRHEKAALKRCFHHAGHLLKHTSFTAKTYQPNAETLSRQAYAFAATGLALGVLGFMIAIFWYTIATPALLTGLFIAGGIAGIVAIAKASKVIKNKEANEDQRIRARIAVALGTLAVIIALLPGIGILLEPLLTT